MITVRIEKKFENPDKQAELDELVLEVKKAIALGWKIVQLEAR